MVITFTCGNCGQRFVVDVRAFGVTAKCTKCGQTLPVLIQSFTTDTIADKPVKPRVPMPMPMLMQQPIGRTERTGRAALLWIAGGILFLGGIIGILGYQLAVEGGQYGSVAASNSDNPIDTLNTGALKPESKLAIESASPALIQTVKVAAADSTVYADAQDALLAGFKSKGDKAMDDGRADGMSGIVNSNQAASVEDAAGVRMTLEQKAKGLVEFRGVLVTPQERTQREEQERHLAEHQRELEDTQRRADAQLLKADLTDKQWAKELYGKSVKDVTTLLGSPDSTVDGVACLNFWYLHRVLDENSGKKETLVVSFLNSSSIVRYNHTVYKVGELGRQPIMFTDYVVKSLGFDDYSSATPATKEAISTILQRLEHD